MVDFKKRDFDEFVKREYAASLTATDKKPFDPKHELDVWLEHLNSLYATLSEYVREYTDQGLITQEIGKIELWEEFSGKYSAPTMTIKMGLKEVRILPIGTMLIGSKGRADIVGVMGRARLVLLNSKVSARQMVSVRIVDASKPSIPKPNEEQEIEWVWKIVGSPLSPSFVDLSKESFLNAMLQVSDV